MLQTFISIFLCLLSILSALSAASFSVGEKYRGFVVTSSLEMPELGGHFTELTHEESGALVLHIHAPDQENFFALSFLTPPSSSRGAGHVLEHSTLDGSKKFPVELSLSMRKRCLNTFMNAFTCSDFTYYTAASQVEDDFYHLLQVYLDAVFDPLLSPTSFAKQAHRLEFATPDNSLTPLEYQGIVYNEMNGVLSSPDARLWYAINTELFAGTPLRFVAGGIPDEILTLSHEEVIHFYKQHYYPANCLFFFYGDIPLEKHLEFLDQFAPLHGEKRKEAPSLLLQPRFSKEIRKDLFYPSSEEEATLMGFSWLTASIQESRDLIALQVLYSALMSSETSVFKNTLRHSGLCEDIDIYFHTDKAETPYTFIVKGGKVEDAEKIEAVIRKVFEEFARDGIPEDLVRGAMNQGELESAEIVRGQTPIGHTLFWKCAVARQHGGNAGEYVRTQSRLDDLRTTLQNDTKYFDTKYFDTKYLQNIILKYFVNNSHFVRITMQPSAELAREEALKKQKQLDTITQSLSQKEISDIIYLSKELHENPSAEMLSLLPKSSLASISKTARHFDLVQSSHGSVAVFHHPAPTNHLTYVDLTFPLPEIEEKDLWLVKLFCSLFPKEIGNATYLETSLELHHHSDDASLFFPAFHITAKTHNRDADFLFHILSHSINTLDFTDKELLKQPIFKECTQLENTIPQYPLHYAWNLSLASKSAANHIKNTWNGLEYFFAIKRLCSQFDQRADELIAALTKLKEAILYSGQAQLMITCEQPAYDTYVKSDFGGLIHLPVSSYRPYKSNALSSKASSSPMAYFISSSVAYTTMGFNTLYYNHPDSASVALAAKIFTNCVLLKRIREQGSAYMSEASYNPTTGIFHFYSYRDSHIASTVSAFQEAIDAVVRGEFDEHDVEEAKLQLLQELDTPMTPRSRGQKAYDNFLEGKTDAMIQAFRARVFNASSEDIKNAVAAHIASRFTESTLVTFSNKELIEKESDLLGISFTGLSVQQ